MFVKAVPLILNTIMSILEIVFVGQCEVFKSCIFWHFSFPFFPLIAKPIGPRTGCQFLKNVDFPGIYPLNNIQIKNQEHGHLSFFFFFFFFFFE